LGSVHFSGAKCTPLIIGDDTSPFVTLTGANIYMPVMLRKRYNFTTSVDVACHVSTLRSIESTCACKMSLMPFCPLPFPPSLLSLTCGTHVSGYHQPPVVDPLGNKPWSSDTCFAVPGRGGPADGDLQQEVADAVVVAQASSASRWRAHWPWPAARWSWWRRLQLRHQHQHQLP
jgi:hypothetical protein